LYPPSAAQPTADVPVIFIGRCLGRSFALGGPAALDFSLVEIGYAISHMNRRNVGRHRLIQRRLLCVVINA